MRKMYVHMMEMGALSLLRGLQGEEESEMDRGPGDNEGLDHMNSGMKDIEDYWMKAGERDRKRYCNLNLISFVCHHCHHYYHYHRHCHNCYNLSPSPPPLSLSSLSSLSSSS
jgi:hypothetical protein